jgi:hypothetical protein
MRLFSVKLVVKHQNPHSMKPTDIRVRMRLLRRTAKQQLIRAGHHAYLFIACCLRLEKTCRSLGVLLVKRASSPVVRALEPYRSDLIRIVLLLIETALIWNVTQLHIAVIEAQKHPLGAYYSMINGTAQSRARGRGD